MKRKQQEGVVQDRCPDIEQASGGDAVDVLTEIKLDAVMEDKVEEEPRADSGVLVMKDDLEMALCPERHDIATRWGRR